MRFLFPLHRSQSQISFESLFGFVVLFSVPFTAMRGFFWHFLIVLCLLRQAAGKKKRYDNLTMCVSMAHARILGA